MPGRKTDDEPDANRKRAARSGANGKDALRPVRALIEKSSPDWLSEFLFDWQSSLALSRGVEVIQLSRADVVAALSATEFAAATLSQILSHTPVREFLDGASSTDTGTGQAAASAGRFAGTGKGGIAFSGTRR
jgi:hypothetical protein